MRELLLRVALVVLGCASTACDQMFGDRDARQPGTALGTFHVVGDQTANACGEGALGAKPTWEFDVDLARAEGILFWDNGANIIQGTIDGDDVSFDISGRVIVDMRGPDMPPGPPCSVERRDRARGVLGDAGDDVAGFEGTMSYDFAPVGGSICDDLVVGELSVAPVFAVLPCGIAYDVKATRSAAPAD